MKRTTFANNCQRMYFVMVSSCFLIITTSQMVMGFSIIPNTIRNTRPSVALYYDANKKKEEEEAPIDKMKLRLEMNWILTKSNEETADECEVFSVATECGGDIVCEDCSGVGQKQCEFCRGTSMIGMMVGSIKDLTNTPHSSTFYPCPICTKGHVACSKCRSTGYIAPWAAIEQVQRKIPTAAALSSSTKKPKKSNPNDEFQ